jgi:hypothetical protein
MSLVVVVLVAVLVVEDRGRGAVKDVVAEEADVLEEELDPGRLAPDWP